MSIQHPHVLNVKFCKHHLEVGTTGQIEDFLYGCVVPLEEAGIDVIKAGLACGCTVWMRHELTGAHGGKVRETTRPTVRKEPTPVEKRAVPAAPPTAGSGTPAAKSRTKGRALRPTESLPLPFDLPFGGK